MAAGEPVLEIHAVMPPNTLAATRSTILGTSTPTENFPVWVFNKDTSWYMDFHCRLAENYDGGGITVEIVYSAASATLETLWAAAIRRVTDDAEDLDTTAHTYDYNLATEDTAPSAIGETKTVSIAFTSGADMDGLTAGEMFVLRIQRDADAAADDMDGDAYLHRVSMHETP